LHLGLHLCQAAWLRKCELQQGSGLHTCAFKCSSTVRKCDHGLRTATTGTLSTTIWRPCLPKVLITGSRKLSLHSSTYTDNSAIGLLSVWVRYRFAQLVLDYNKELFNNVNTGCDIAEMEVVLPSEEEVNRDIQNRLEASIS
jgi:hypothetical protein